MMRFRRGGSTGRSEDSSAKLEQAPLNADFASNSSPRGVASPSSYDFNRNKARRSDNNNHTNVVSSPPLGDQHMNGRNNHGRSKKSSRRSASTGRPNRTWRENRKTNSRRSASTGRAVSRHSSHRRLEDDYDPNVPRYVTHPFDGSDDVSQTELLVDASESNEYTDRTDEFPVITESNKEESEKKKKSKMEKIRQLQAKNELYKTEFKRVQKDRKRLKRELETKTLEVDSLTKEIDTYIADTSALKSKLSEALQQLDRTDHNDKKVDAEISHLAGELESAQRELKTAQERVADLLEQLDAMEESVRRKDDQIKSLTREISEESHQIEMLRNETTMVRRLHQQEVEKEKKKQQGLEEEKEKLQSELGSTLERAAAMVKEREDAIADLLKENDEMKRMAAAQGASQHNVSEAEIVELREKLATNAVALEEAEDRIVMLEEDLDHSIRRNNEMEAEIVELREEVSSLEERASTAQKAKEFVARDVQSKEREAQSAQKALHDLKAKYEAQFAEMEIKLRAAQMAAAEKETEKEDSSVGSQSGASSRSAGSQDAQNVQAMSLEMIVAKKKKQKEEAAKKSGWGLFSKAEPQVELDEKQLRIKELESINADQEEEIKKLKSDLVRLRSTHNEESYISKKKIERLETENHDYEKRIIELEREVSSRADFPDVLSTSDDGSAKSS